MKNETIGAVVALILIILGVQTYMVFKLNDRLNQLSGQDSQTSSFEIKIPKLPSS
ncbi:MAG: heat-shock protein Hsp20, partial [Methylobacter sp.]